MLYILKYDIENRFRYQFLLLPCLSKLDLRAIILHISIPNLLTLAIKDSEI